MNVWNKPSSTVYVGNSLEISNQFSSSEETKNVRLKEDLNAIQELNTYLNSKVAYLSYETFAII